MARTLPALPAIPSVFLPEARPLLAEFVGLVVQAALLGEMAPVSLTDRCDALVEELDGMGLAQFAGDMSDWLARAV